MKKLTLISLLFIFQLASISGQVVSSGKVIIHIKNTPNIEQGKTMTQTVNNDSFGKYYALIIGINDYKDPAFTKPNTSLRDAELFFNVITSRYTFEKDNVSFLLDARMADIKETLDSFSKKVGPADNFLIFYSGHGYWDDTSETGFWLPSDARGVGFWFIPSDDNESTKLAWLSNSMLGDWLRMINSKHTLLITDACFGGSMLNGRSVSVDAAVEVNKLNQVRGRKAITRGILSNVPEQGDFFSNLLDKLEKNSEKYLPSEKLFDSLSKPVLDKTTIIPRFGEIKSLGDEGGDFIFILKD